MATSARLIVLGLTITLLHGCDLGTDDAVSTPQVTAPSAGTTYSLATLQSAQANFGRSFTVTGFDSSGADLRGTFSIQNLAATTFNGSPATPRLRSLALTDTGTNAFTTREEVLYLGSGFQVLGSIDPATNVTCIPDAPFATLPATGEIGENGNLGTLTCSDGNQHRLSWRIDGTTSGRALAVIATAVNDPTGLPLSTEEERYVIDTAGTLHGVVLFLMDLRTGISISLQSPVV